MRVTLVLMNKSDIPDIENIELDNELHLENPGRIYQVLGKITSEFLSERSARIF